MLVFGNQSAKTLQRLGLLCLKVSRFIKLQYNGQVLKISGLSESKICHLEYHFQYGFFETVGPVDHFEGTFDSKQLMSAFRTISLTSVDRLTMRFSHPELHLEFSCAFGVTCHKRVVQVESIGWSQLSSQMRAVNRMSSAPPLTAQIFGSFSDSSRTSVLSLSLQPDLAILSSSDLLHPSAPTVSVNLPLQDFSNVYLPVPTAVSFSYPESKVFISSFPDDFLLWSFGGGVVCLSAGRTGVEGVMTLSCNEQVATPAHGSQVHAMGTPVHATPVHMTPAHANPAHDPAATPVPATPAHWSPTDAMPASEHETRPGNYIQSRVSVSTFPPSHFAEPGSPGNLEFYEDDALLEAVIMEEEAILEEGERLVDELIPATPSQLDHAHLEEFDTLW